MRPILFLAMIALAGGLAIGCKHESTPAPGSSSAKQYTTSGTIKSFGSNRASVNIEHDDIPGYMSSMTMSFEPRTPDQIAGFKEGDRIHFTFTDQGEKRLIDEVKK